MIPMITATDKYGDNPHEEFNKFQDDFFRSFDRFSSYTRFEIKRNGYKLFNNIAKGYPALVSKVGSTGGFGWKAVESPQVLQALQRLLHDRGRLPGYIFFKGNKEAEEKVKVKKTSDGLIFDTETKMQVMNKLMIDDKTYEYIRFTPVVQDLGKMFAGDWINNENMKKTRKKQ
jgi:hypothetical protein